jgi:hypothetical protein
MALANRISHNGFRTIAYTKKKWFRMNFFDRNFEDINVINDNEMTYLSRYLCRYLLTALELLSSTFRLCQQQL